jgi:hypothetical protein
MAPIDKKVTSNQTDKECYEVQGTELNVRKTTSSKSEILKVYKQGEIVCGTQQMDSPWVGIDKDGLAIRI